MVTARAVTNHLGYQTGFDFDFKTQELGKRLDIWAIESPRCMEYGTILEMMDFGPAKSFHLLGSWLLRNGHNFQDVCEWGKSKNSRLRVVVIGHKEYRADGYKIYVKGQHSAPV